MSGPAPYFALLFNAALWALSWWPLQTLHAAGVAAVWATALMYTLLLVGLSLLAPRSWQGLYRHPVLWLLALSAGLTNVTFNTATSTGDVVRVILLFYLMPAWSLLLAWRVLGERPTPQGLLRLGLALVGMVLIIVPEGASWGRLFAEIERPDGLALIGGICFACTGVLLRRDQASPATARMLAMFVGCALTSSTIALLGTATGLLAPLPAAGTWVWLALGFAAFIGVGNAALQYGASRLPAATTGLVMLSEVPMASASAWLLGATDITARMALGGVLIVAGALLAALQKRPATSPTAA